MATRAFLDKDQLEDLAKSFLRPPSRPPDGEESQLAQFDPYTFAKVLAQALQERFRLSLGDVWDAAAPIAVGSWSRDELSPRSDLDLVFAGEEAAAAEVTRWAQSQGIKIRARVPESREDWTIGVEAFDVLALLRARALTESGEGVLLLQQVQLEARLKSLRRDFFRVCRREREARVKRHDSIANYLEPNLKFGPGALRDLEQALSLRRLFPDRFETDEHAVAIYEYYKRFYLLVRHRVHVAGSGGDVLSAYDQAPVAEWMGYASARDFMRELQKGLSRVSFYADTDFARGARSEAKVFRRRRFVNLGQLTSALEQSPDLLTQLEAREQGRSLWRASGPGGREALGELLAKALDPHESEELAVAFFRSRLADLAVSGFTKLVGWVQHDQYHRYSADAHLLQAVREVKRVARHPKRIGRLGRYTKDFSREDWRILGWAALYHDIGKGSGRDHSDASREIAERDLRAWGLKPRFIDEVLWLVEHHLAMSQAAFRGNPALPSTWRELHDIGCEGERARRLAVFTAIDVWATNREAWTPWKERLLADLMEQLERPEALSFSKFMKALVEISDRSLDRSGKSVSENADAAGLSQFAEVLQIAERLDPFLVAAVSPRVLASDLHEVWKQEIRQGLSRDPSGVGRADVGTIKVIRTAKSGRVLVRFHVPVDRPGLLVGFARALHQVGLSVRHASILTDETLGVYDWFEVKPPRGEFQPKRWEARLLSAWEAVNVSPSAPQALPQVKFQRIELLSQTSDEWVISLQGVDQAGALRTALEALLEEGLSIRWAKVHTWGKSLDDVLGVQARKDLVAEDVVARLARRLC